MSKLESSNKANKELNLNNCVINKGAILTSAGSRKLTRYFAHYFRLPQTLYKKGSYKLNPTDDKNIKLTNSIQNLTKAVWVIAIILLVDVLLSIFPLVFPDAYLNLFTKSVIGYDSSENISIKESQNIIDEVSFHELAFDEKILESNMIILVEYIPSDDGRLIATVKEHLKLSNDKDVAYKIGDEYLPSSYYPKEGYSHGDGAILLFRGSSKRAIATFSVYDGRIPSYGDKTIKQLKKELIK